MSRQDSHECPRNRCSQSYFPSRILQRATFEPKAGVRQLSFGLQTRSKQMLRETLGLVNIFFLPLQVFFASLIISILDRNYLSRDAHGDLLR